MRRLLALLVGCALTFSLAGCGATSPYAAKVNGQTISKSDIDFELNAIVANERYLDSLQQNNQRIVGSGGEGTFDMAFVSVVLTRSIYIELVHQEFARRKLEISSADRDRAKTEIEASFDGAEIVRGFSKAYIDQLTRITAEISVLQAAMAEADVSDAALRKFYTDNPSLFAQTCVSHILTSTEAEAVAAKARVDQGEAFEEVAKAVSTDQGSAPSGGDLSCVTAGNFVAEFETAMEGLDTGQVSTPVQSEFGFHIIKVRERTTQPFASVSAQIRDHLLANGQAAFNEFVRDAVTAAEISVNPRYGTFDRSSDQPSVVPPSAPRAKRGNTQIPGITIPGEDESEGGETE